MSEKIIQNIINELNSSLAITIKEKNEEMNFFNKTDNGINIQPQTIEYSFYNGKTVSISGISEKIIELYNGDKFFENKSFIEDVPEDGEFVRWLETQNIKFQELPLIKTKELHMMGSLKIYLKWVCVVKMRI